MSSTFSLESFATGALAACGAVTFTNPFEVVKTRMQLQGELQMRGQANQLYSNAFTGFLTILKNEGVRGIQRGLVTAYAYQIILNGTRLGLYEPVKLKLQKTVDKLSGHQGSIPILSMIGSGATTGVLGAFLASPLFLIKTVPFLNSKKKSKLKSHEKRIQSLTSSNLIVGHQHTYLNQGILHAFRMIYVNEGIRGLWRGVDASMVRTGIGSAVQLSSYDTCKAKIASLGIFDLESRRKQIQLHFSASLLTSFFVCLAMNPFDVASTRMYNQKTAENNKTGSLYRNGLDCIQKTIRTEGISALYKGFTAHYLRVGPHTVLTFVFLEQIKKWNLEHH